MAAEPTRLIALRVRHLVRTTRRHGQRNRQRRSKNQRLTNSSLHSSSAMKSSVRAGVRAGPANKKTGVAEYLTGIRSRRLTHQLASRSTRVAIIWSADKILSLLARQ